MVLMFASPPDAHLLPPTVPIPFQPTEGGRVSSERPAGG